MDLGAGRLLQPRHYCIGEATTAVLQRQGAAEVPFELQGTLRPTEDGANTEVMHILCTSSMPGHRFISELYSISR